MHARIDTHNNTYMFLAKEETNPHTGHQKRKCDFRDIIINKKPLGGVYTIV